MSPERPRAADNMHSFYDLPKINRHVDAEVKYTPWTLTQFTTCNSMQKNNLVYTQFFNSVVKGTLSQISKTCFIFLRITMMQKKFRV